MDTMWFYVQGGERRGPLTIEELVGALLAAPDPHRILVWNEGMPDWQEAGSVPGISGRLPPSKFPSRPNQHSAAFFEGAEAIAQLYRRLVLLVGLQLLLGIAQVLSPISLSPEAAPLVVVIISLALICVLVAMAVTAYKLTSRFGESLPLLWAIVMFIPCLNIVGLLILSSKAQAWCQQHGIKVGLLGPTKESIEELRRRMQTSHFE